MDRSAPIYLVSADYMIDNIGQRVRVETQRQVFSRVRSVTGNEFFNAGKNGITSQYQVTLFKYDYNGEAIVLLNGKRYAVYRTYESTRDDIELYLQMEEGVKHG